MPDYARIAHFRLTRKIMRRGIMDYKAFLVHTQTKMAAFLDKRVTELIDHEFRAELEELAEKICFQNLINQYKKRHLPIPAAIAQRLTHEAIERKTAKIKRGAALTTEGETGELLPPT